jgi:hypothetical protein
MPEISVANAQDRGFTRDPIKAQAVLGWKLYQDMNNVRKPPLYTRVLFAVHRGIYKDCKTHDNLVRRRTITQK